MELKPGNILLDDERKTIKISDFGISTEVKARMTNVKRTCTGTPYYMSPEVILGKPYSFSVF